ncbi:MULTISPECIES: hypothetical protein [Pseudomonas syringae group genomosp. 2]|uniref:Phage protein n=2 Tax=Pseudomonas savastanoi TaxID=29438 RepID=A0A267KCZ8_PSESS|nr:hypothetical protein [Pseudomonas savastanoi]ARD11404.1 hypothetical protein PSA3335_10195 [Pseudomonas savastanoi pv. savastanoi NCPPB 3335]MBA4702959.1 hypothetical protein [Pseudomonas savastanoi pv. savastanoi]PAB32827.1 hypothetical protein CC205_13615 [Pseudomonas savastanoi pv. nerii]RMN71295.1 hypothetical protein ALQ55_102241 [Pseudomonas savastanoi pv. savastanoi]RMT72319.1 putative phage protein [Pseudomonas savastanoi pv. nerii]
MATVLASLAAARVAYPQTLVKPNLQGADIQVLVSTYTVPAGGQAIGDVISWGFLPLGARLMPGTKFYFGAGAASSGINLGDAVLANRYMTTASLAAAGSAAAENQYAGGALFEVGVVKPNDATDMSELRSQVLGAALQAGQVITLVAQYAGQN